MWSLIALGALIFLIGVVMMISDPSANTTAATAMHFNASGIVKELDGTYSLNVYAKNTSLLVYADPGNNVGKRVTFTVMGGGEQYIQKPENVYPGGMTTITLKTDPSNNNAFYYGQKIQIHAQCGQIQKVLFVTISVPDKISFGYQLNYFYYTPLSEISAETYTERVYGPQPNNEYRLDTRFYIDGIQIRNAIENETLNRVKWSAVSLEANYEVEIIGENVEIPIGILQMVSLDVEKKPLIINFLVTAEYLGKKYTDIFTLKIVP